jgi:hypothetical protein
LVSRLLPSSLYASQIPRKFNDDFFGTRFRYGCEKKALSLSVDLEPIEVIIVVAVALNWQEATENRLVQSLEKRSNRVWKPKEEGWLSG